MYVMIANVLHLQATTVLLADRVQAMTETDFQTIAAV